MIRRPEIGGGRSRDSTSSDRSAVPEPRSSERNVMTRNVLLSVGFALIATWQIPGLARAEGASAGAERGPAEAVGPAPAAAAQEGGKAEAADGEEPPHLPGQLSSKFPIN